jgi:hypothetical protein
LWYALADAQASRAVTLRQQIALVGHVRIDLDHLCVKVVTPQNMVAVIEDLVREGQLRRAQGTHIEEALLQQVDRYGCWQGETWTGEERLTTLPDDVVAFTDIGKT